MPATPAVVALRAVKSSRDLPAALTLMLLAALPVEAQVPLSEDAFREWGDRQGLHRHQLGSISTNPSLSYT